MRSSWRICASVRRTSFYKRTAEVGFLSMKQQLRETKPSWSSRTTVCFCFTLILFSFTCDELKQIVPSSSFGPGLFGVPYSSWSDSSVPGCRTGSDRKHLLPPQLWSPAGQPGPRRGLTTVWRYAEHFKYLKEYLTVVDKGEVYLLFYSSLRHWCRSNPLKCTDVQWTLVEPDVFVHVPGHPISAQLSSW